MHVRHLWKRALAALLCTIFLQLSVPFAPAEAMSTAKEVAQGEQLNREVDRQSILVTDPFLTSWVGRIGSNLSQFRARTDITYRFEILNSDEINSFALPGGYIHLDMGLLNFAASDDELASVMGHEMGHIERRHVITLASKANILGIIIGVLSILSPLAYILGGYGGDLAINKFSREDELQADHYGLLLMSRAGYNPHADVDLMARLAQMAKDQPAESKFDRAFADHPEAKNRVAHLLGYPELDNPSIDQLLARAIHDEDEGMYAYAQSGLKDILKRRPSDALALRHETVTTGALTEPSPRQVAQTASAADPPAMLSLAQAMASAHGVTTGDLSAAKAGAHSGGPELESFFNKLNTLSSTVPDLPNPGAKAAHLKVMADGLDQLVRDVNGVLGYASDALDVGPGLIADNQSALRDMAASIADGRLSPKTQALLPYYPLLVAQLTRSSDDVVAGVARARAAVSLGSASVQALSDFFNAANGVKLDKSGDLSPADWARVQPALTTALAAWDKTNDVAARADDLVYAAQTRELSAQLTLLDLLSSPDRYAGYRKALTYRFPGVAFPDYSAALNSGMPAGELACAGWLAFETKQSAQSVLDAVRQSDTPCPELALQKHLMAESMEVAVGLVYSGYITKPQPLNNL